MGLLFVAVVLLGAGTFTGDDSAADIWLSKIAVLLLGSSIIVSWPRK